MKKRFLSYIAQFFFFFWGGDSSKSCKSPKLKGCCALGRNIVSILFYLENNLKGNSVYIESISQHILLIVVVILV